MEGILSVCGRSAPEIADRQVKWLIVGRGFRRSAKAAGPAEECQAVEGTVCPSTGAPGR